jgi:hypothetical protein
MTIHEGSDDRAVDPKPRGGEETLADEELLCSEEEFTQEVRELVAADAPQVFALVEEYGERVDGWIEAWGMAFDDHIDVLGVNGGLHASLSSVERVHRVFSRRRKIRLVWTSPAPSARAGKLTHP